MIDEYELNDNCLTGICAALCGAVGVGAPEYAAEANAKLAGYFEKTLGGEKADRLFIFSGDALAQWIFEKYPQFFAYATDEADVKIPLRAVMPSVTPVCFGSIYTGAMPSVHGIQAYCKPVIRIDTIFDALIRAGKRVALLVETDCSMAKIFLERDMDYYIYDTDPEINAKCAELILKDEYDVIINYNGNYDTVMHRFGPESREALAQAEANAQTFAMLSHMINEHWTSHNTVTGFIMDHGCHEIDGGCGSHGLEMPEDMNIVHLYKAIKHA